MDGGLVPPLCSPFPPNAHHPPSTLNKRIREHSTTATSVSAYLALTGCEWCLGGTTRTVAHGGRQVYKQLSSCEFNCMRAHFTARRATFLQPRRLHGRPQGHDHRMHSTRKTHKPHMTAILQLFLLVADQLLQNVEALRQGWRAIIPR